jgi:hypothetical protein
MATTYTIGPRVLEWTMPGVIRRIEIMALGVHIRAGSAALVAGLHPTHIEREGLADLSLLELAERWPDHMAEQMAGKWSTPDYVAAAGAAYSQVLARFMAEMGMEAVDAAEGNSLDAEVAPHDLDNASEEPKGVGVV